MGLDIKQQILEYYVQKYVSQLDIQKCQYKIYIKKLKNREFAIYGAGVFGKKVLEELRYMNLEPKTFIVTRIDDNQKEIGGIPVVEIDNVEDKVIPIIVATTSKYAFDIVDTLVNHDYKDFCVYPC